MYDPLIIFMLVLSGILLIGAIVLLPIVVMFHWQRKRFYE